MELIAYDPERYAQLNQRSGRLRTRFKSFFEHLQPLAEPNFPIAGIAASLSEDGEIVHLKYRSIAIDIVLTIELADGIPRGRVTAMLTKHPLLTKPFRIDTFFFQIDGKTDIPQITGEDTDMPAVALDVVLAVVERAAYLNPGTIPESGHP